MTPTRKIIVELLSQLGSSREAREYLRKFSSNDSYQFAVIKVGGEIIRDNLAQLASSLAFLYQAGLFPILLHGAGAQLNEALTAAGVSTRKVDGMRVTTEEVMAIARPVIYEQNLRLVEALEDLGIRTRSLQHGVFDCDFANRDQLGLVGHIVNVRLEGIKSAVSSGSLPIVSCMGESPSGQMMNVNADVAARQLVLATKPYKIIFISPTGGLLDESNRVISAINLETDYERLITSDWVHSGMRLKLTQINELLAELPLSSSVSITSAENLTRELFTHRGAGTLIRRGEGFREIQCPTDDERRDLSELIGECFQRRLCDDYFDHQVLLRVIAANSGRAAAVFTQGYNGIPYMDKFVVTPPAQGEGVGAALWEQVRLQFDRLYWRSRVDNPINSWYMKQSDFAVRGGHWRVFGYGLPDLTDIGALVQDAQGRPEMWQEVVAS